ncbi:MAG: ABC transporter permease [Oscillospiraceae bacterium]|jgi:simple sugar transport system permease protein|nr:ABC transporter permease [Oscillospiraceae bacterium]
MLKLKETARKNAQLLFPLVSLFAIVIINLIVEPNFFSLELRVNNVGNTVLSGNVISILDNGSELAILAIGMTLVTAASGGQDISVGAAIAIAGGVVLRVLCGNEASPDILHAPIIYAFLASCVVAMLFGAFNGVLVSIFKIQPMIATLILFTSGRSIGYWIGGGQIAKISEKQFGYFGGFIPGVPVPTPILIAVLCMIVIALVLKFTNLGLYTQAVGINEKSARLNGLNPVRIKLLAYIIIGFCVAVAAFIKVSRMSTINYSSVAQDIEMDVILAVAIGGNALGGGKFNMAGSIIGAYTIQALTVTLYAMPGVTSESIRFYKALVIIILVVISSPAVKSALEKLWAKLFPKKSPPVKEALV